MGDKDQDLGRRDIMRRGATEDVDAEGLGFKRVAADGTDEPPSEDAEGHGIRWGGAAPDQDQPPSDDEAEGHIRGRS